MVESVTTQIERLPKVQHETSPKDSRLELLSRIGAASNVQCDVSPLIEQRPALQVRRGVSPGVGQLSISKPAISVVIINFNGAFWLERCLASLRNQTIAGQLEIIVADNASPDHSGRLAVKLLQDWPQAQVCHHETNLGYAGGNDRAAARANGRYLLFLNHDTWLEPDCLEHLLRETETAQAAAATPLVMDYADNRMQSAGESGFDVFGLPCGPAQWPCRREIFVASGPALLIERNLFESLGGFDRQFFMYADEYDLCWRVWASGRKVILAPTARLHHRGAPAANPNGGQKVLESRTSDTKRFYANRNGLLVLLKNCQHLLLFLVPLQLLLLAVEALAMGALARRWSHVRRAYVEAVRDCWRLRRHILVERRRLRNFRRHGDFWMLRFLGWRLNRWREFRRVRRFGLPRVDPK